jgi:hypothetical protein
MNYKRYVEIIAEMSQDGCVCLSEEDKEIMRTCTAELAKQGAAERMVCCMYGLKRLNKSQKNRYQDK